MNDGHDQLRWSMHLWNCYRLNACLERPADYLGGPVWHFKRVTTLCTPHKHLTHVPPIDYTGKMGTRWWGHLTKCYKLRLCHRGNYMGWHLEVFCPYDGLGQSSFLKQKTEDATNE